MLDGVYLGSCLQVGLGLRLGSGLGLASEVRKEARGRRIKWVKGSHRLKVGSWNIGSLSKKSIEQVIIIRKRQIIMECL